MNQSLLFKFLKRLSMACICGLFFTTFLFTQQAIEKTFQAQAGHPLDQENHLTVHEWGTFTSLAGEDGAALEWRPLNGASDLPDFVYKIQDLAPKGLRHNYQQKRNMEAFIRMETPVIYFYADREIVVAAKVDFPNGKITEWFPQARRVSTGIDWGRFTVLPKATMTLPEENRDSHYYPARETDAAILRVCGHQTTQHEKFLFYRGVGNFHPPLKVRLDGEQMVLKNTSAEKISTAIVFANRRGQSGYRVVTFTNREATLALSSITLNSTALEAELEKLLLAQGLYEKEAQAMLKTWRSSWFEEGLRVFYLLPRRTTDAVLPLHIAPQPQQTVRVLVCRTEVITPEMEARVQASVEKLQAPSLPEREEGKREMEQYGRFAEPILKRLLKKTFDTALQTQIAQLLMASQNANERE
ncbi:MAG: hypothetical protein HY231_04560 [Acidobacteria bacterium]|nr:hypothetical protein [Acidobacteriota bacterium]